MTKESLPQVVRDDERIDEFGRYFLCTVVQKLDEVLRLSVANTVKRRDICTLFADNLAMFLDAGWLQNDHEKLWPILAFATRVNDGQEEEVGEIDELVIPVRESFLSEGGTQGAIIRHFDADKEAMEALKFRSGLRGEDILPLS